jgi:hypothetical protein
MALSDAERGAVFLAASTSIGVFTGILPEFSEVRKSVGDEAMTNDVRMGEVAAAALVVGLGLLASSITDSPAPAIASVACAAVLVIMYEAILQSTPTEKKAATP